MVDLPAGAAGYVLDGAAAVLLPVLRPLADDALKAWQPVLEYSYDDLVAKDSLSPCIGGRTLIWLKGKRPQYRQGERGWKPKR
jgi:hypothetical protein